MSETNVTEIKSLEGHPLADVKAREKIEALTKDMGKALLLEEGIQTVVVTSDNLYNPADVEVGGYYSYTDGAWTTRSDICSTGFIPCAPGDVFYFVQNGGVVHYGGNMTCYDKDHNFIVGVNVTNPNSAIESPGTIPDNENIRYFRISFQTSLYNANTYQINKDEIKQYDEYATTVYNTTAYNAEYDVLAPNINAMKAKVDTALILTKKEPEVVTTSDNLCNPQDCIPGGYYQYNNGAWIARSDIQSTGLIPCKPGDVYYAVRGGVENVAGQLTCYDEDGNYVAGANVTQVDGAYPINIPSNENIRYFRMSVLNWYFNTSYQINKDEIKPYDKYSAEVRDISGYYSEHNVYAPNITELDKKVKDGGKANKLYFAQTYNNDVTIMHKRSVVHETTYWLFVVNDVGFGGNTIKPRIVGTDPDNPLGGTGNTNVTAFCLKNNYAHVVNGGIYLSANNEADGITIIDGQILKSVGVEQFAVEQYVLGIDASGNFKTYRNASAESILADGSIYALTGFVPMIENGEAVSDSVLAVCPHYNVKHPRQVIGRLKDGKYFTFACDGRTDGEAGMTLRECIATIMADLDVEFAFDLDGGGSTQSTVGKKLVNRRIDNRAIPNVIVFE